MGINNPGYSLNVLSEVSGAEAIGHDEGNVQIAISRRAVTLNTHELLINDAKVKAGQHVFTNGYYAETDGGFNKYLIVPEGSEVVDNIRVFDIPGAGVQAVALFPLGYATPEMIGYNGTNAGTVINAAFDSVLPVRLKSKAYIVDTAIMVRSNASLIGEGDGWDKSVLQAKSDLIGNVIDTKDFDALLAGDIVEGNPAVGLACPTGFILRDFAIKGNKATYPGGYSAVLAGNGIGMRIYGKQFQIENIRINSCANVGLITKLSQLGNFDAPFSFESNSKAGKIQGVYIYDTGHESFIFDGPTDIWLNNIYCGASNGERESVVLDPLYDSVEEVGIGAHGVVVRASCEIGFLHAFGNPQGYAFWCEGRNVPATVVRLRFQYLMGESGFGLIHLGNRCRPSGNLLESHANVFGDGSNPHINIEVEKSSQIANIDIYRDGIELGSTGLKVANTAPLSAAVKFDYSGTWDQKGHMLEVDGYGHNLSASGVSGSVGLAKDGTNSAGIIFGQTFDNSRVEAAIRGCEDGVRFSAAVLSSKLGLNIRDCVSNGIVGYSNVGEYVRLNADITEKNTALNGLTKRNKFKGYVEFDNTLATTQLVNIAHNLIDIPLKRDVQLTPYYVSGSLGIIQKVWVNNVDATNIEVGYHVDGTGAAGVTRVGVLVV